MSVNEFDHIIKEKLSNASAVPPPHILENLQFDMLINEKLAVAAKTPPPHIWDKIAAVILPATKPFFTSWKIASSIVLLISVVSLMFVFNSDVEKDSFVGQDQIIANPSENNASHSNTLATSENNSTPRNSTEESTEVLTPLENESPQQGIDIDVEVHDSQLANQDAIERNVGSESDVSHTVEQGNIPPNTVEYIISNSTEESPIQKMDVISPYLEEAIEIAADVAQIDTIKPKDNSDQNKGEETVIAEDDNSSESTNENPNLDGQNGVNGDPIKGTIKPNPRNLNQYSLSLRYAPDLMTVNQQQFYRHGLDLSFGLQNSQFIFETGIVGQYTNTRSEYELNYLNYNEYVGTYDSIVVGAPTSDTSFNPSSFIATNIYDTIEHIYGSSATQHYANIRIPLMIGYQKDFRDYSFYAKAGFMYNLNIYQQTSGIEDPADVSEIIELNYPKQTLYKSQIEYIIAVGGNLDISRNLKLTAEIVGRYTHYSYFLNENLNGVGVGARFGLLYEL